MGTTSETNVKKADKGAEIDKMLTEIDQMSARSAQLKGEVSALQSALTELTVTQTDMDERSTQVAGAVAGLLLLAAGSPWHKLQNRSIY